VSDSANLNGRIAHIFFARSRVLKFAADINGESGQPM
jgi:hypothetical protein